MATWALPNRPPAASLTLAAAAAAAAGISISLALRYTIHQRSKKPSSKILKSPASTLLPRLSPEEISALAYPPDILPGARDVETPYGNIKVFEWGPEAGEKALLLHGISTPCLSLANVADELVEQGYRVILFDFFGRGYSDAPTDVPYDIRLYTTQILLVLASSSLSWTGDDAFHLMGYSLGGAIAVPFARYFPKMVKSLVLVAGGGLIREEHVSWQSKVLYSTGIFPEWVLEGLVRKRLAPRKGGNSEEEMAKEVVDVKKERNSDASGGDSYDNAVLTTRRPGLTVSKVMEWQLKYHKGFIKAFMSSIRNAPIYEQREEWVKLGQVLAPRRDILEGLLSWPGLRGGKILLILGKDDPVIDKEELIHDATELLGEDAVESIWLACGHEIVMAKGQGVAKLAVLFWRDEF